MLIEKATPQQLLSAICSIYNIRQDKIVGKYKGASRGALVKIRAVYSYIGIEMGMGPVELGRAMKRDHATVLHHAKEYREHLNDLAPWFDPALKAEIQSVKYRLKTRLINI